ncbi:hypothetical protein LCGC14_0288440 [marine sediment metagenome]|uniref:Uncharacterized protein n=1 Tax=marine sediment metagenome TaxID=412755 RepID=A0A0F9UAN3_9ZZZZ
MDRVDLIASGYDWICPDCNLINTEIEAVTEAVTCGQGGKDVLQGVIDSGCGRTFAPGLPEHAYE